MECRWDMGGVWVSYGWGGGGRSVYHGHRVDVAAQVIAATVTKAFIYSGPEWVRQEVGKDGIAPGTYF